MIVNNKIDNKKLTVYVEGRLDTNTVPELQNKLPYLDDIKELVFDFEKVEYISSSGLRLILKCKKSVDDTKVINCNPEVYEIFNMTGFSEMMEVKKAFRNISIENCEKVGEGFCGIIYRLDPETIVKVYKIPDSLDMIKRETEISRKAFVMGIPTAIPYDIVKVGDLYGAVFELVNAESLIDLIQDDLILDDFTKKSAELLKTMHKKEIQSGELPNRKEFFINILADNKNFFSQETYDKLLSLYNSIPDTNTLVHSDFHIKNIMLQDDELLLIDMESVSIGHPIFDFASMYASYIAFSCVDKHNTDKFFGLPLTVTTKLFKKTFKYYYNDKSEEELNEIEKKISMISYLYVLYLRTKFSEFGYGTEKEEIKFSVDYLTENAKELDTLSF